MDNRVDVPSPAETAFWQRFFRIAALYDGILGAAFFLLWKPIFRLLKIERPKNTSYIAISAAYVFVQGLSYWFVAHDLRRNTDIVRVGVVYKATYTAIAVYFLAAGKLIHNVFAWFAVFDVAFLVCFVNFLKSARRWQQAAVQEEEAR